MKKVLISIVMLMSATALIGRDRPVQYNQLPAKARTTLDTYYPGVKISYATYDNDIIEQHYEVVLVNGAKIDFRKNGEWRSIDCERDAVPAGLVPAEVARFVKANHPDNFVVDINREGIEMEVQLNNGLDMKFTRSGNFKYYDD